MRANPRFTANTGLLVVLLTVALPAWADISGTVIDNQGQPIEGALVTVLDSTANIVDNERWLSADPAPPSIASAETDSKGNYRIELDRKLTSLDLELSADGYFPVRVVVPHDSWVGATVLRKADRVSGRVVAGSAPVAGAHVIFGTSDGGELRAVTDEKGSFSIPKPPAGSVETVAIAHPDYAPATSRWRSGDDLTFRLRKGTSISARAVGPDGKTPVAGASVFIDGWPLATTGEDGTFTIAHAPDDWTEARITRGNLIAAVRRSTAKTAAVTLKPASTVSGTVADAGSGRAIPGVRVALLREGAFPGAPGVPVQRVISDEAGRFSIAGVLPGTYRLVSSHPSWTDASEQVIVLGDASVTTRLQIRSAATIEGRTTNDRGEAVAASLVAARQDDSRPRFRMRGFGGPSSSVARSAPDGRFVMFDVEPDEEIRLEGSHPAYPQARTEPFDPESGKTISGKTIIFPRGVALTGTVTTVGDVPVSGARLHASKPQSGMAGMRMVMIGGASESEDPVLTDAKGRFQLKLEAGTWNILAEADGFAPARLNAIEVAESNEPLEIRLEEGAIVQGRVLREGTGVSGVMVTVIANQQPREPVTTGPDGSFTLADLPRGSAMLIAAKPDEFIQEMRSVEAPSRDLTIEIPAGGTVRGRVVEKATGDAITDFQAGPNPERGGGAMRVRVAGSMLAFHSDDGEFVLENVPPGRTEIIVEAPGFVQQTLRGIEVKSGETVDDIKVELSRGVRVTGKVRGPNGAPVAGANVAIQRGEQSPFPIPGLDSSTATDSSGAYVIAAAEPGEATIVFSKDGLAPSRRTVELSGEEVTVDATLESGQTVTGTVVTSTGAPVLSAAVRATSSTQNGLFEMARTDGNGQFRLEGLVAGRYTFTAQHDDYVTAVQRDVDVSSGQSIRLVMDAGGSITGRVLGVDQSAYASIVVRAQSSGPTATAAVSPDGTFRIEGVKPGTATVSAQMREMLDNRSTQPVTVEVSAGATASVDLEFSGGSTVTGRVTKYGEPLRSGLVQMIPTGRPMQAATSNVDADGKYKIEGVAPGSYEVIVVDLQSFSPFSKKVEIRSDNETIDIDIRGGKVTGRVIDSTSSQPVENVSIVLEPEGAEEGRRFARLGATTSASGEFTIDPVPEGNYRLRAERSGYGHGTRNLFVTDGRTENVDLGLQPSSGLALRVVDGRDGRPLSADVIAYDGSGQIAWEGRPTPREDGEIRVPVAPGSYRVRVFTPGYAPATVQLASPGSVQTVGLTTGGTLVVNSGAGERRRARITDAWGQPARGSRWDRSGDVWLDPGTNSIENLAPGQYTIQIFGADGSATETRSAVVREGDATTISI